MIKIDKDYLDLMIVLYLDFLIETLLMLKVVQFIHLKCLNL